MTAEPVELLDLRIQAGRLAYPIFLAIGDVAAYAAALTLGYEMRVHFWSHWIPPPFLQTLPGLFREVWIPLVVIGVLGFEGLYTRRVPFWEETQAAVRAIFMAFVTVFAIVSLGKLSGNISRVVLFETGLLLLFFLPLFRYFYKPLLHRLGIGIKRAVLIGDNRWSRVAHLGLFRDAHMGIRIVGWIDLPDDPDFRIRMDEEEEAYPVEEPLSGKNVPFPPYLGKFEELPAWVRKKSLRGAVVAAPHLRRQEISQLIARVQRHVLSVYVVPNVAQVNLVNSELLYLFYEEIFLLGIHNNLKSRANRLLKSLFDRVGAVLILIVLFPVLLGIALLVVLTSNGPAFYTQSRVGRGESVFRIYKFRTMWEDADKKLEEVLGDDPEKAEQFRMNHKIEDDPRVTPLGRFLRRTSLDEFPQIFNVLKGEMSLVGPRPVTREELDNRYRDAAEDYCLVNPGMTGLWQVSGRSERGYGVRVRLDLWYIRNWSLWLDLVILIRTVGVVLNGKGSW